MTMDPGRETRAQIEDAYRRMATEVDYHPMAPSDGFGHVTGPIDTDAEARQFVDYWWRDEDARSYWIGCPGWSDRPALIFAVHGANVICGAGADPDRRQLAADLLRMAAAEPRPTPYGSPPMIIGGGGRMADAWRTLGARRPDCHGNRGTDPFPALARPLPCSGQLPATRHPVRRLHRSATMTTSKEAADGQT